MYIFFFTLLKIILDQVWQNIILFSTSSYLVLLIAIMPSKNWTKRKYKKQIYDNRNAAGGPTSPTHSDNDSLAGAPTCVPFPSNTSEGSIDYNLHFSIIIYLQLQQHPPLLLLSNLGIQ